MKCKRCQGTGNRFEGKSMVRIDCPDCQGSGESEACPKCGKIVPADVTAKKRRRGLRMAQIYPYMRPYYHVCNECLEVYNALVESQMDARREFFKGIEST